MKVSSVRFALSAASPLSAGLCPFGCASLWVGLRLGLFGSGRNLNGGLAKR